MKKFFMPTILFTLTFATTMLAYADHKLSAEEAKALFSNKTWDGYNKLDGTSYVVYSAADGAHNRERGDGKRLTNKWFINDAGQHCTERPAKCLDVIHKGEGVYHKMDGNVHVRTVKNFRTGDQR